jgi:hypothetical protein
MSSVFKILVPIGHVINIIMVSVQSNILVLIIYILFRSSTHLIHKNSHTSVTVLNV